MADPCGFIRQADDTGGATELMEVLGKEESLARIQTAIDRLSQEHRRLYGVK